MTTTTTMIATETIRASSLPRLMEKIKKINRKAKRLGFEEIVVRNFNARTEERTVPTGYSIDGPIYRKRPVRVLDITLTGQQVKLDGYTLVAVLLHEGEDNLISKRPVKDGETEHEVPADYRTRRVCDHCGTQRRRNLTYLLISDAGEYRQVGKSCMADFMGLATVEKLLGEADIWASITRAIRDEDEWGSTGTRSADGDELHTVLTMSAAVIDDRGWVSATRARDSGGHLHSTRGVVETMLYVNPLPKHETRVVPTEEHADEAEAAMEWALEQDTANNDYLHNLAALAKNGYTIWRTFGLAVSLIAAYRRAMERLENQKAEVNSTKNSQFQGTVKERLRDRLAKVSYMTSWGTEWGETFLVKLVDVDGNVYATFATTEPRIKGAAWDDDKALVGRGQWVRFTGTVKKHETYKDIPQTILNRVVWHETYEEKPEAAQAA
jgi:hypothetical protein